MKATPISFYVLLLILPLVFLSCTKDGKQGGVESGLINSDSTPEKHEAETDITATQAGKPQFTVGEVFQGQLNALFTSYLELKEAFVASDVNKVKKEADDTQKALGEVDMKVLTGEAHNDWMNFLKEMETSLNSIKTGTDIEVQRTAFSNLSENLYKSIKAFGIGGKTIAYYEFCPMAFNDKGAYWLSDTEKIRNPYFGDKMLTCGTVEEKLQ